MSVSVSLSFSAEANWQKGLTPRQDSGAPDARVGDAAGAGPPKVNSRGFGFALPMAAAERDAGSQRFERRQMMPCAAKVGPSIGTSTAVSMGHV